MDDDCDGQVDEGNPCSTGHLCQSGSCNACITTPPAPTTIPCGETQNYLLCTGVSGTVTGTKCGAGQLCNAGQCISDQCTPGTSTTCYEGPPGTAGTGECRAGTRTCSPGGTWGACTGQTLPAAELCNAKDEDCDGVLNDGAPCDGGKICVPLNSAASCQACGPVPAPSTIPCGSVATGWTCNGQAWGIPGERCSDPLAFCSNGQCVAQQYTLTVNGADEVVSGTAAVLTPLVTPRPSGAYYEARGWMQGVTAGTFVKPTDDTMLGAKTVEVKARAEILGVPRDLTGWTPFTVRVTCNPVAPPKGACCTPGATTYRTSGACAYTPGEPGSGTCNANGACERNCVIDPYNPVLGCFEGRLYAYDDCGARRDLVDDCPAHGTVCAGTACVDAPPVCSGEYRWECANNNGYRTDLGCGATTLVVTCAGGETCTASATGVTCRAPQPCDGRPGTILCGSRCIDPLTSRTDCGRCNHACNPNELCQAGSCTPIPGCNVVCDTNDDCPRGQTCIYSGSCTQSQCQAQDLLNTSDADATNILEALTAGGLLRLTTTIKGALITYRLDNLAPTPAKNIAITSTIGKAIATSRSPSQPVRLNRLCGLTTCHLHSSAPAEPGAVRRAGRLPGSEDPGAEVSHDYWRARCDSKQPVADLG